MTQTTGSSSATCHHYACLSDGDWIWSGDKYICKMVTGLPCTGHAWVAGIGFRKEMVGIGEKDIGDNISMSLAKQELGFPKFLEI